MIAHGSRPATRALRCLAAALMVAALCMLMAAAGQISPRQAHAAQDATLTVVVQHGGGSTATSIDGMTLEAYEVAKVSSSGSYEPTAAFASAGVDFNAQMTAEQAIAAASTLSGVAKTCKPDATAVTGADGKAAFGTLDNGIYLVVQNGATGTAKKYSTLVPWLVNVPQRSGNDVVYDVVSMPKPELAPVPSGDDGKKVTPSKSVVPKTGDSANWPLVLGCFGAGLAIMLAGVAVSRRSRR